MKSLIRCSSIFIVLIIMNLQFSLAQSRPTLTVLNIDTEGLGYTPEQMGGLVRLEANKLDMYEVMDKYDVAYMIDKHKLNITNCYGKMGLVEVGNIIKSDKMLSGSVEILGEVIILTLRLIDVKSSTTEKTHVKEFMNLPKEIQLMVRLTLQEMFALEIDKNIESRLTKKYDYDNTINNPDKTSLNLSGPRMGFTCYTGESAAFVRKPKSEGGYDAFPVMFQFGYQFELQYLNEGNFQALFEIIPTVTGLDQGLAIPSLTLLNGLRNNVKGWEFAFGPTLNLVSKAKGYYDANDVWHLENEWDYNNGNTNPFPIIERTDSRGTPKINTGFIIAAGKSFKSGHLNIPVNIYAIPSKSGFRLGASFGYNAKKKR